MSDHDQRGEESTMEDEPTTTWPSDDEIRDEGCDPDTGCYRGADRFEIICHYTGDRAEAEDEQAALVAADTLARDAAGHIGSHGALGAARRTLAIIENGTYNGTLTEFARRGVTRVAA